MPDRLTSSAALNCVIKWTKRSTYQPSTHLELRAFIWPIYIYFKGESQPSVWWYLSDPTQDLGTLTPFEPCWIQRKHFAKLMKTWILTHLLLFSCQHASENRVPANMVYVHLKVKVTPVYLQPSVMITRQNFLKKWPKTFFYLFEFRPFVGEKLPKTITQWAIIYTQVKYTRYTWKPSLMVTQ